MDIVCPACAATYEIDGSALTEQGRKVRCAQCQTVWRVFPKAAEVAELRPIIAEAVIAESALAAPEPAAGGLDQDELDKLFGDFDAAPAAQEPATRESAAQEPAAQEPAAVESAAAPMVAPMAANDAAPSGPPAEAAASPDVMTAAVAASPDAAPEPAIAAQPEPEPAPRAKLVRPAKTVQKKSKGFLGSLLSWPVAGTAAALTLLAGAVLQKNRVVDWLPQTARLYAAIGMPVNLRGIEIANVKSRLIDDNGIQVLVVDGDLRNVAGKKVDVPRLRFSVIGGRGDEIYAWSAQADRPNLNPGESLNFRRRLAAPPQDGQRVNVRFLTAADVTAGIGK